VVVVLSSLLVVVKDARALAPDPPLRLLERAVTDQSFPRTARLLNGKAYGSVFKKNRRFGDRYWTVLVHQNRQSETPGRLGLAIAKKRAKRAVDRNRIKRVAREQFRRQRQQLNSLDLVIMNRDAATKASAKQLGDSLQVLIGQIVAQGSNDCAPIRARSMDKGAQRTG